MNDIEKLIEEIEQYKRSLIPFRVYFYTDLLGVELESSITPNQLLDHLERFKNDGNKFLPPMIELRKHLSKTNRIFFVTLKE